jgi:hypothetical protein
MSPKWNNEQAEEALNRFCKITPALQQDKRFNSGVVLGKNGVYIPFVYLASQPPKEGKMPEKYVLVIRTQEGFRLSIEGFFILVGIGIPVKSWPKIVSESELSDTILEIWKRWFQFSPSDDARPL